MGIDPTDLIQMQSKMVGSKSMSPYNWSFVNSFGDTDVSAFVVNGHREEKEALLADFSDGTIKYWLELHFANKDSMLKNESYQKLSELRKGSETHINF